MKKILAVAFWAFVLLAIAGQIAGADAVAGGDTDYEWGGGGIAWHYLVCAIIGILCCFL